MSVYKSLGRRCQPITMTTTAAGAYYNRPLLVVSLVTSMEARRTLVSSPKESDSKREDLYDHTKVTAMVGHNFPDFVEKWNRHVFRKVGYAFIGLTGASLLWPISSAIPLTQFGAYIPSVVLTALTTAYWKVGLSDLAQTQHTIRRNYPVLGNIRYIFETIRPEIRQVRGLVKGRGHHGFFDAFYHKTNSAFFYFSYTYNICDSTLSKQTPRVDLLIVHIDLEYISAQKMLMTQPALEH